MEKISKVPVVQDQAAVQSFDFTSFAEKLVEKAIEKGSPMEVLDKVMEMRQKMKAEWAKEQYDQAMAQFQGECPVIQKKTKGQYGSYASLDLIVSETKELRLKNGFSYFFKADTKGEEITATCVVTHKDGHKEESAFSSKVDKIISAKGSVRTSGQDVAAALTYAKRYAFCNAFGIMTGDVDLDSVPAKDNSAWIEKINACQSREDLKKINQEMKNNDPEALKDKSLVVAFNARLAKFPATPAQPVVEGAK